MCAGITSQRLLYLGSDNKDSSSCSFSKTVEREEEAIGESSSFPKHLQVTPTMSFSERSQTSNPFLGRQLGLMHYIAHITVSASLNFLPLQRSWNQDSSHICNIIL